tara:strand:- start:690 stop:932 length:243 start_codon:yes stop_codon:yes gene_type:complete
MSEKRCVYKCGAWNCGSYQFNLYKDDIDQGELCDVHYWQTKAQRPWVGLTEEDMKDPKTHSFDFIYGARWAETKLKERNG